ncbi:hypothetical protein FHR92_002453 [Fontibacillus solani]|uniref:Uncharacterized protein n=1 Tax=Fontibacillus solani TaxID=1572857 RepID=A0A7W3STH9_9BACL|nr:hypothetical protein [Fontibacillus solani]MBA9085981.1 hypothetical protein [Fontibacillus solani]
MTEIIKRWKTENNGALKILSVEYFLDFYRVLVLIKVEDKETIVHQVVNYPSTSYKTLEEIINEVFDSTNSTSETKTITKDDFDNLLVLYDLKDVFTNKIKHELPDEVSYKLI